MIYTSITPEEQRAEKSRFHPHAETKAPVPTGESKKEPVRNHQVVLMMCLFLIGHPWFTSITCEENAKKGRFLVGHPWFTSITFEENAKKGRFHPHAETKSPVQLVKARRSPQNLNT
jgi:hypothetical protein